MCQARLNHCIVLHVLKDRIDMLDNKEIAKEFIKRKKGAQKLFWTTTIATVAMPACMFLI